MPSVHETAVVEAGAEIGEGTRIWHHAHVRTGARIGSDCVLGKNVFVDEGVVIGDRVKIQNNVSVYKGVNLEDEVFVGPSAVFTNDLFPRSHNPEWSPVATLLRRGASVGANATVLAGTEIGEWAMVAAGSVVTRDVEPHRLVAGVPARPVGWVCICGRVLTRAPEPPHGKPCEACGRDFVTGT